MTCSPTVRGVMCLFVGALGGLACGSASPTTEANLVCPRCKAGASPASGLASRAAPTPCQLSERAVPVDAATARELGFGVVLDRVVRSFDSPFAWAVDPWSVGDGQPARGYAPTTTARGQTTITAIDHLVPSLAGCPDSVAVALHVSFSTGDKAIAIEGALEVNSPRDAEAPSGWGAIDLTGARGALELFPGPSEVPLSGYLNVGIDFWPETVRGHAEVSVGVAGDEGSDTPSFWYHPLQGRWPIDDCQSSEWPMGPAEPGATPDGRSAIGLLADFQAMLDAAPMNGSWDGGGGDAVVTAELGSPVGICRGNHGLGYRTTLGVTTSDGRVRIHGDARAYAGFDPAHALSNAWVEIYEGSVKSTDTFAASTGISGVDFGVLEGAFWHTELRFADEGQIGVRGSLVVEGVDVNGRAGSVTGAITGPLATFTWR